MDYICIRDCDNSLLNSYKSDRVYTYEIGTVYQYYMKVNYAKNTLYTNGKYCGWVTNEFVNTNFIPHNEYNNILKEVDELFEGFLQFS